MLTLILALGFVQATPNTPVSAIEPTPIKTVNATVFAYTSTVGQTDASPFTTASGAAVADGIVANNCLPFGTVVSFPDQFGTKKFVVQDRMAARYGCNSFDIWFSNTQAALQFGKRYTKVNVY
jgi:3D (Asp-Asp-Asp) domain-containing protein